MKAEAYGVNPAEVAVDISATEFSLYYHNGDQAFVEVEGVTVVDYGDGNVLTIDWAADSLAEEVDVYGEHFYRTDEVWQICIERYVPDLEFNGDEE